MNKILFFRRNNNDLNIKFWNFKNILKNVKLLFYTLVNLSRKFLCHNWSRHQVVRAEFVQCLNAAGGLGQPSSY